MANFSAYGGPLEFGSGAIGYEFDNRYLNNQEMSAISKQRLTSLPNSFQALPEMNTYNAFAEGGGLSREKNYGSKKSLIHLFLLETLQDLTEVTQYQLKLMQEMHSD